MTDYTDIDENTYEDLLFELEDDYPEHHLIIKQQVVKVMLKGVDPAYGGFINMYIEELLSEVKNNKHIIERHEDALSRLEALT